MQTSRRQRIPKARKPPITTKSGIRVRSKFEKRVADSLSDRGVRYLYEKTKISYVEPAVERTYTPDFQLRGRDWWLECKGVLTYIERKKLLDIRASNPDKEIRLLFQRDNVIYRGSKTRYTDWAKANGFKCAVGEVPQEWLEEWHTNATD